MRIAIGGIMHESNSFSAKPTTLESFREAALTEGEDIRRIWGEAKHEVGGYFEEFDRKGVEIVPTLMSWATPSGMVEVSAIDHMVGRILDRLGKAGSVDGLLLALHGAMVLEGFRDGDGEILRRIRERVGRDLPLVCTLDFHANISNAMVDLSDALLVYQTNPHVDQRPRGIEAAKLIQRMIAGEVKPTQSLAKPAMIFPILHQNTSVEPLRPLMEEIRAMESEEGILGASVVAGFPYADVPEIGASVVVVTDNDPDRAQREAQRLSDKLKAMTPVLETNLPDASEAVRQANASDAEPIVLVEMGDNVGGGSAADSTFILSELLKQKAERSVVVLYDPKAVRACVAAGARNEVELDVGGKTDQIHGAPVHIKGRVKCLHDGCYEETEVRHGGKRFNDQGLTAVVELENRNMVVLTTFREPPFSLQQIVSLGISPQSMRNLVVKAAIAYRAAYQPIAGKIIEVDTPGTTTPNPLRLEYKNVPRPIFPLD